MQDPRRSVRDLSMQLNFTLNTVSKFLRAFEKVPNTDTKTSNSRHILQKKRPSKFKFVGKFLGKNLGWEVFPTRSILLTYLMIKIILMIEVIFTIKQNLYKDDITYSRLSL
jgi:hypothetical protein